MHSLVLPLIQKSVIFTFVLSESSLTLNEFYLEHVLTSTTSNNFIRSDFKCLDGQFI